eukprot:sb/3472299/
MFVPYPSFPTPRVTYRNVLSWIRQLKSPVTLVTITKVPTTSRLPAMIATNMMISTVEGKTKHLKYRVSDVTLSPTSLAGTAGTELTLTCHTGMNATNITWVKQINGTKTNVTFGRNETTLEVIVPDYTRGDVSYGCEVEFEEDFVYRSNYANLTTLGMFKVPQWKTTV